MDAAGQVNRGVVFGEESMDQTDTYDWLIVTKIGKQRHVGRRLQVIVVASLPKYALFYVLVNSGRQPSDYTSCRGIARLL